MNRIKVFYLGYDIQSVILINSKLDFELVGVATIPELQETSSYNLADAIFRQTYRHHKSNNNPGMRNNILCFIIGAISCFMSCIYRKYAPYLQYLLKHNIAVYDEEYITNFRHLDVLIVNNWWKISSDILDIPKRLFNNKCENRSPFS